MKLTRASSYAIHALAYLAAHDNSKPVPSHLVARAQGIPERFLLKVLKPLVSTRVLHSIKGPNGGYRLAKNPSQVSVLDVLEAVDGPIRGQATPANDGTNGKINKQLDEACNLAAEQVRKQFQKIRISDLATKVKT